MENRSVAELWGGRERERESVHNLIPSRASRVSSSRTLWFRGDCTQCQGRRDPPLQVERTRPNGVSWDWRGERETLSRFSHFRGIRLLDSRIRYPLRSSNLEKRGLFFYGDEYTNFELIEICPEWTFQLIESNVELFPAFLNNQILFRWNFYPQPSLYLSSTKATW